MSSSLGTLKRATITNFQSHEETIIDFHDGVNAIVGLSDSGKSALFRALQWCFTNKPTGDAFRRYNTDYTGVLLEFSDGQAVLREKDKKDNIYVLYTSDDKEETFKAFKTDIPLDIQSALNINQLNIQSQLEAPFLLSSSASDVAKLLNQITNLDKIDTSLSFVRRKLSQHQQDKRRFDASVSENEEKLKEFEGLDTLEQYVVKQETLESEIMELDSSINILNKICDDLVKYENDIKSIPDVSEAQALLATADVVTKRITELQNAYSRLHRDLKDIKEYSETFNEVKEVDKYFKWLENAQILQKEVLTIQTKSDSLNKLLDDLEEAYDYGEQVVEELVACEKQYKTDFPDVCPLCGK